MFLVRARTELLHLSEHGHRAAAARARELDEGGERRAHAGGVRVVRVVEDDDVLERAHGRAPLGQAQRGERIAGNARGQRPAPERFGGGDGRREVDRSRLPDERNDRFERSLRPRAGDDDTRPVDTERFAVDEAVARVLRAAEGQDVRGDRPRERAERRPVVGARERRPVRRERAEDGPLLTRHVCARPADPLGMCDPPVRNHGDVGRRDRAERGDLSPQAHPHLEHDEAVVRLEPEHDGRKPDAIVQIPERLVARRHRAEKRRAELFRRGLPGAPGDCEDARRLGSARTSPCAQVRRGERAPRSERVVDLDDVDPFRDRAPVASPDDEKRRPAHGGFGEVVVPVVRVATKRDERSPFDHRPAIGRDAHRVRPIASHASRGPAGRSGSAPDRERRAVRRDWGRHQVTPVGPGTEGIAPRNACRVRRFASARRASSRSSKWRFSVPMIW